jgi:hypothetical protein
MRRWLPIALSVAVGFGMAAIYYAAHVPDLSPKQAADLISRTPEFNRYARLIKIETLFHQKKSMDSVTDGTFTFQYLNFPTDAPRSRRMLISGTGTGCGISISLTMDAPRNVTS